MENLMVRLGNKFAIGCLVQWYEIEIIEEYIESLKQSLKQIDNKENIIVDFKLVIKKKKKKINDETTMDEIITRFEKMIDGNVQPEDIEQIRLWRNQQMHVLRQSKFISKEEQIAYYEKYVWATENEK